MEKEYVQKIRNMRVISDDPNLLHHTSSYGPIALGTIEVIDGKEYKVIDNMHVGIVITYEPVVK